MKDSPRQQFRWAPHVSGCASLKPKDYEQRGQIEALHEYDAWRLLRESGEGLEVGDLLETEATVRAVGSLTRDDLARMRGAVRDMERAHRSADVTAMTAANRRDSPDLNQPIIHSKDKGRADACQGSRRSLGRAIHRRA